MKTNEELINQMKLDHLRSKLAEGERDLAEGRYTEFKPEELSDHFQLIKIAHAQCKTYNKEK